MAKKTGGLNLNPGADSSIVASATKAAMAAKPVDLSKQFGMIAQGYSQQMAAFGKIGAQLGAVAGQLALPLVDKAVDNIRFQVGKVGKTPDDIDPTMVSDLEKMVDNIKGVIRGDVNSDLVKEEWDNIFPELKGKYEKTDLSTLDESQIKKIKNYGKRLKNNWISDANAYRAGNMESDFNAANMSPYMELGWNNDQLLFATAGSFNGAPIPTEYTDNTEFQGVQRRPVIKNGEIQYGLYKEVGGELKEVAGVDESGFIQFVGERDHNKPHMIRNIKDFNKDWVTESQFRTTFNEPYQSVVNNALKGIEFDADALKSTLLMAKTEDGQPLTTNDIKDLSTMQFAGMSQSFSDYLNGINATTAKAYLEADPNWKSRLVDIDGDGEINSKEDYLDVDNFEDKDSFPDAYANTINAIRTDKNAFVNFVVSELEKTHDKYAPTKTTGGTSGTSSPTTGTERAQSSFVNKILTGEPTVSLGGGNPTWTRGKMYVPDWDQEMEFYYTKMTDGTYEVRDPYSLNADYGGNQAVGSSNKRFNDFNNEPFDKNTINYLQNTLLEQDPEYQTQLKEQELKIQTEERDVFMRDVFSEHPDFTKGAIGKDDGHEDAAIRFFETRYPGMNYVTSYMGRDQLTVSVPNEPSVSFKVNLDSPNYTSLLPKFEKWYEANKPNL
jgi:hypothetical protein